MKKKEKRTNKIFIILGSTSTGKTSLGLELCKQFNGEIISADSRQVIKYMDIGTGKVPVDSNISVEKKDKYWILDGIKIWGYDLVNPNQYFSSYDFAKFALKKSREIIDLEKNVFIVGGTGFYIDMFTGRVKPSNVKPDLEIRKYLERLTPEDLQKKLFDLNPVVFEKIDKENKVRLIRAVEKEINQEKKSNKLPYLDDCEFIFIGLSGPREVLYKNSDTWVDKIWENGLIDEVRGLIERSYTNSPKLHGLVYKTVLSYVSGEIKKEDAIQRTKYDVHAYIRRQLTWFKRNKDIKWVDISKDGYKEIIYNSIERVLKGNF